MAALQSRRCARIRGLIRAPLWFIGLLVVAAIFVGVYAYLTTPLPFGLSGVIRTPASSSAAPVATQPNGTPTGRAGAGQPLALGSASVVVQAVQRNQDLTAADRGGPPGVFTVVDLQVANAGSEPLNALPSDFRLIDDQGRIYAIDPDATRSENAFGHRRNLFDASVPPGGVVSSFLAFQTTPNTNAATLRVQLGYGELELPR
jgi:Domain of unknown function (DUF4352)